MQKKALNVFFSGCEVAGLRMNRIRKIASDMMGMISRMDEVVYTQISCFRNLPADLLKSQIL